VVALSRDPSTEATSVDGTSLVVKYQGLHGFNLRSALTAKPKRSEPISALFSEESYLAANPDVAEAIRRGEFTSGKEHFDLHGRHEGRLGGFTAVANTRPIFFCHIPKAAGTLVRQALEQAFAPHMIMPDVYMIARNEGRYPPISIFKDSLSHQSGAVRLLRGHYPFAARRLLEDPLTITVLRDPVQRSISELRHLVSIGILDQTEIAESLESNVLPAMSNAQVRFLSAGPDEDFPWDVPRGANSRVEPGQAELEIALKALEAIDILGLVEDMPGFSARLEQATGVQLSDERSNVGDVRLALSQQQIEVIRQHNLLDAVLYKRALSLLSMASEPIESERGSPAG
jgi:hypothetical protein